MARPKGTEKTGGRKAGTPNKVTTELKTWIQELIDGNRSKFEKDLDALEPKDRLQVLNSFLQYVVPKQQAISMEAQVELEYKELEKLLDKAPDKVVDALLERMNNLKTNEDED